MPKAPALLEEATEAIAATESEVDHFQDRPVRIGWARLLKQVLAST